MLGILQYNNYYCCCEQLLVHVHVTSYYILESYKLHIHINYVLVLYIIKSTAYDTT